MLLFAEVLLIGTEAVQEAVSDVNAALESVALNVHRFDGGPAQQFRSAFREERRGEAVVAAHGGLIAAMRGDVTLPHLPDAG